MRELIERDGYAPARGVVSSDDLARLSTALGEVEGAGRRGVLGLEAVRAIACSDPFHRLAGECLSGRPRPVRGIFFDKSAASNWLVPWHQDVTIAVKRRVEVEGFGPWSLKDGLPHVQPPESLLARMITLRLHLDDADSSNGALRVIPGSHAFGRLSAERVAEIRAEAAEVTCEAGAGEVLLMRPLLLHASSKSNGERRRRVLHLEYCADDLPGGLEWEEVGGAAG